MLKTSLIRLFRLIFAWSLRDKDRTYGAFRAPWWLELRPGSHRLRRCFWEAVFGGLEPGVQLAEGTKVVGPNGIQIGEGTRITSDIVLDGRGGLSFGRNALVGFQSTILTYSHRFSGTEPILHQGMESAPVSIGDGVWLGTRVIVVPGVTIGDHAIVGAGAVVTRDVPQGAIAAGNPARVIRYRDGFAG